MTALVSVIITTYKREMWVLERAINTVCQQTYTNVEIVLVNDYPPYENCICELLKKYPMVKFVSHSENKGACKTRNDGLKIATGEYVAFLDDDDEWQATKIEKQVRAMQEKDVDLVYCNGEYYDQDGTKKDMSFIKENKDKPLETLLEENYIGGCSFPLIRKSVLMSVGGFSEDMPSSQDYDLWLRIVQCGATAYLDESLVKYYLQYDSITLNYQKRVMGYYKLLEKHQSLYKQFPKARARMYKRIARLGYLESDLKTINIALIKSFQCFPHNCSVIFCVLRLYYLWIKKNVKK